MAIGVAFRIGETFDDDRSAGRHGVGHEARPLCSTDILLTDRRAHDRSALRDDAQIVNEVLRNLDPVDVKAPQVGER